MKFTSFALKKELINALNGLGYIDATKVQDVVIPKALKNENIIVQSETGTGKTHSFLIPILNNLEFNSIPQALIICPTRELARQTYNFIVEFKKFFNTLNAKLFVSGIETKKSEKSLKNGCEIIIATPGRLNYLLDNVEINLSSLKTIVLDEADMLFDAGFNELIDEIISKLKNPQIEVFSATISKKVEAFLRKYISPDYVLTLNEKSSTSSNVSHYFINTKHRDTKNLILDFIKIKNPYLLMIFANTKEEVQEIYEFLSSNNYKCGILSGSLTKRERNSMLRRINNNEFSIIVCSDIASRGLDILDVSDVLSINLPNNIEYYYHRAGRTGRNQNFGSSYVFYDNETVTKVRKLIDNGLNAKFLKFESDELIFDHNVILNRQFKKKKNTNDELNKEIKKAISKNKSDKIKPGYKKKVKMAVEKVKKSHRRQIIKKDIRRQMTERYRNNAK